MALPKKSDEEKAQLERFMKEVRLQSLKEMFLRLITLGVFSVDQMVLLSWLSALRMTPRLWKVVNKTFQEVAEQQGEAGWQLFVGVAENTYSFVIWDRVDGGLGSESSTWWNPIEYYEDLTPKKRGKGTKDADESAHEADGEEEATSDID